ncbi:uncharacterized protein LOC107781528 [Nicotiana tabacum]|uniref:Uncharacterized protein LOC107781528 n=1 Tax=Nicotiana tabacum TaxID=4097 RepID=A0AC58S4W4_TOBAC
MASLSPDNSFANYDKDRIMKPATLYPHEFSSSKIEDLSYELDNYILFVNEDNDFSNLKGLGDLSETLVETDLYKTWRLIFLLVKLSLMLLVAIAMVEIAFSSMKYIKNDLRRGIGDEFLNDCLVCYIENEVFESVPNDVKMSNSVNGGENNNLEDHGENGVAVPGVGVPPQNPGNAPEPVPVDAAQQLAITQL